jgi:hypothetical protein
VEAEMKKIIVILICLTVTASAGCAWIKGQRLKGKKAKESVTCLTYNIESVIARPTPEVFESIRQWKTYTESVPRARFNRISSPQINGLGDYIEGHANGLVGNLPWRLVVTRYEPGRQIGFSLAEGLRGSYLSTLTPLGDKTRINITIHLFLLPDTTMGQAFDNLVKQGTSAVEAKEDQLITDIMRRAKAQLEGVDPATVRFEQPPRYEIFVDSFFMIEEKLPVSPARAFKSLASNETMTALLPLDPIAPAGGSPRDVAAVGNHYRASSRPELGPRVDYDLIAIQFIPGKEARYVFSAHDVIMEWDLFITPELKGSTVQMLFMIDLPPEQTGPTLDVIIQTNSIDKYVQKKVEEWKKSLSKG